jgi:hypothetical protein
MATVADYALFVPVVVALVERIAELSGEKKV